MRKTATPTRRRQPGGAASTSPENQNPKNRWMLHTSPITFIPGEVSSYYAARVPHLKQLGLEEWRGACPKHSGKDDNFAVNAKTGEEFCFSQCRRGWDIIALEQALTGADFKTAMSQVFRLIGRLDSPSGNHSARARIVAT